MKRLDVARWIAAAAALILFVLAFRLPAEPEYWWHVAVGRLLSVHHAVANTNPFVYAAPADAPVLLQPWIGQYWLHELHVAGDLVLVLSLRNVLFAATMALLAAATWRRSRDILSTVLATVTVGIAAAWAVPLGPEMFAFPLAAFSALACLGMQDPEARASGLPHAVVLVATAAFWANLAPGFAIPAVCAAAFAVASAARPGRRRRAALLAVTSAAALGATLLNPRGLETWATITDGVPLAVVTALFVAQIALARRFGDSVPKSRHPLVSIAAIALFLGLALAVQPWSVLHAPIVTTVLPGVRQSDPLRGVAPADLPVEAVEVVRSWGSTPRVFIAPEHAGYYLARVAGTRPMPLVWSDPSGLPGAETVKLVGELYRHPQALWRGVFQQWDVEAAILDRQRDAGLVEAMSSAPDWRVAYSEGDQVLFQRIQRGSVVE